MQSKRAVSTLQREVSTQTGWVLQVAELRPKHCVLAGTSGTHCVCVCTIHQNVKLMLCGARLHELTCSDDNPLLSYHHCLARIICNPPLPDCYLGECKSCPGTDQLKEQLFLVFDELWNILHSHMNSDWLSSLSSYLQIILNHNEPIDSQDKIILTHISDDIYKPDCSNIGNALVYESSVLAHSVWKVRGVSSARSDDT